MVVLLAVFLRRHVKNRYFDLKDERRLVWARMIDAVLRGEAIPVRVSSLRYRWDRAAAEEAVLARVGTASPWQREQLQRLFRGWRLCETRLRRLRQGNRWQQARSALVLAQLHIKEALPDTVGLLESPHAVVRLAAVNALGTLGAPEAVEPLLRLLARGDGREARAVLAALIRAGSSAPAVLRPHLQSQDVRVRIAVSAALAEVATSDEIAVLAQAAADPDPEVRSRVARALGRTAHPHALTPLERLAADSVWFVRLQAVSALARIRLPEVHDLLMRAAADKDGRVPGKAAAALYLYIRDPVCLLERMQEEVRERDAIESLISVLEREGAVWQAINRVCSPLTITRENSQELIAAVVRAGKFAASLYAIEAHPDPGVRAAVLRLVREHAGRAVVAPLREVLASRTLDPVSRREVEEMLAGWEKSS